MLLVQVCFERIPLICFCGVAQGSSEDVQNYPAGWLSSVGEHVLLLVLLCIFCSSQKIADKNCLKIAGQGQVTKCHTSSTWSSDSLEGGKNQTQMSQIGFYFWSRLNSRISASAEEKRRSHPSIMHSNFTLFFHSFFFLLFQVLILKYKLVQTPFLFTSNTCTLTLINALVRKRGLMFLWRCLTYSSKGYTRWNNSSFNGSAVPD